MKRSCGDAGAVAAATAPPIKKSRVPSTFLGRPLNKLDIDEVQLDQEAAAVAGRHGALGKMAALSLAISTSHKSLRTSDQVVRDEQGRRRFHGAFTGGFSAGYFNTVGTAEGWTPGTFQSSRRQKQSDKNTAETSLRNRVEDYMDEEDLENFTTGPRSALTVVNWGRERKDHNTDHDDQDPLSRLFAERSAQTESAWRISSDLTKGFRILRSMGWREGTPLLAPILRRPPRTVTDGPSKRVVGPQLPREVQTRSSTAATSYDQTAPVLTEEDETYDEFWNERRRQVLTSLTVAAGALQRLKSDARGLGYVHIPLSQIGTSAECPLPSKDQQQSQSRMIRGEAFGIGALEEEEAWDRIYGDDEDDDDARRRLAIARTQASEESEEQLAHLGHDSHAARDPKKPWLRQGQGDVHHFVDAASTVTRSDQSNRSIRYLLQRYTVSAPPTTWKESHCPNSTEVKMERDLRNGTGTSRAVALLVQHLQAVRQAGAKTLETQEAVAHPIATEADRRRLALQSQPPSRPEHTAPDRSAPLWGRVSDEAKKAMIASLSVGSRFVKSTLATDAPAASAQQPVDNQRSKEDLVKYPSDPAKQTRYELFCLALDEKIATSLALSQQPSSLSKEEALTERREFGAHYRELRTACPSLDVYQHCSARTAAILKSQEEKEAALPAQYTRTAYNWKPDPLLCRRFGLRDPWDRKRFVDDRPKVVATASNSSSSSNVSASAASGRMLGPSRSQSFVTGLVTLLGGRESKSDDAPAEMPSEKPTPTESRQPVPDNAGQLLPNVPPRPPMSIFRAVFGDEDDD